MVNAGAIATTDLVRGKDPAEKIKVTCDDVARMAATLANGCVNPVTGACPLPAARVRDVLSVMFTCGMYDFAGEWAFAAPGGKLDIVATTDSPLTRALLGHRPGDTVVSTAPAGPQRVQVLSVRPVTA